MVCFPQGMVSLFCKISVTLSTPCRLEELEASAFGLPLVQVYVGTHALTGLCIQVQARTQILIKRLFIFLQHLLLHLSCLRSVLCSACVCFPFMSVQRVDSSSTVWCPISCMWLQVRGGKSFRVPSQKSALRFSDTSCEALQSGRTHEALASVRRGGAPD